MILRLLAGPLIGAVIGYFTNYIAVKMLFYPRREIYLFGHKLPFTPGAIPKGKDRLARAIGNAVGGQLLTGEDIRGKLMSSETTDKLADKLLAETDRTIAQIGIAAAGDEEKFQKAKEMLVAQISDEIYESVRKVPFADMILEKGGAVIREKTAGTMLQMFLNDELINSVAGPVGTEIEEMIREKGRPYIEQEISAKCEETVDQPLAALIGRTVPDREKQKELVIALYDALIERGIAGLMTELDIAGIVEDKINAMEIDALEELVMTVMKKELNTIVNLGALIGFVLGLVGLLL